MEEEGGRKRREKKVEILEEDKYRYIAGINGDSENKVFVFNRRDKF